MRIVENTPWNHQVFYGRDQILAEMHFYDEKEPKDLFLFPGVTAEQEMDILRIMVGAQRRRERPIVDLTIEELRKNIPSITWVTYQTPSAALAAVIEVVKVKGLGFKIVRGQGSIYDDSITVEFTIKGSRRFTFWKSMSKNDSLYIIPPYHPVMKGWESKEMVNGDTDALIRGKAVDSIVAPKESGTNGAFGTTWRYIKHPVKATGHSFQTRINLRKLMSNEGVAEVAQLLRSALNLDKQCVTVVGGFNAPLEHPHYRLVRQGGKSPYPRADYSRQGYLARGSENHCVWTHRVLTNEGKIDGAHIPPWFYQEGWLKIYEDTSAES